MMFMLTDLYSGNAAASPKVKTSTCALDCMRKLPWTLKTVESDRIVIDFIKRIFSLGFTDFVELFSIPVLVGVVRHSVSLSFVLCSFLFIINIFFCLESCEHSKPPLRLQHVVPATLDGLNQRHQRLAAKNR
jgi:hypothetical protein